MQLYRLTDPSAARDLLHTKSPEFLEINPSGHIPSIDDDGLVLHESLAINTWPRSMAANLAENGLMTMWALWAATEVEPHSLTVLTHRVSKPPAERDSILAQAAVDALRAPFAVLDKHLATSCNIVGERFTVADINAAEVIRYAWRLLNCSRVHRE